MKHPLLTKTVIVGVLAIVLMLPVAMIRDLVTERQARSNEAIAGIAEGWGKRQTVAGPYLALPYERRWTEVKRETVDGKQRETRTERVEVNSVRIPATTLEWVVAADISEKTRGIYKARLYSARLSATGSVAVPARSAMEDGKSQYKWHAPRLVVGISDPLGIRSAPETSINGAKMAFAPGSGDGGAGLHAPLPNLDLAKARTLEFSFTLELGGSEALALAPLGADTTVSMRADWPHPS
ncbi:MAG TPA: inner membrane CreD family protein, partial [Burkholderiales bacterium]